MNSTTARFIPSIIAGVALIACFMPLSFNPGATSLIVSPAGFSKAVGTTVLMNNPPATPISPSAAAAIMQLLYLAPLSALGVIALNIFSGPGPRARFMQIAAGVIWIVSATVLPIVGGQLLIRINPFLKQMSEAAGGPSIFDWLTLNFGFGGWLLIFAGVAMVLYARGKLKVPAMQAAE